MRSLEEHEIFAAVVGTPLNIERLSRIAAYHGHGVGDYVDCEEYLVRELSVQDDELVKCFHITEALVIRWKTDKTFFRVHLFVRNDVLIGGHILKYKETIPIGCFRPTGYAVEPTQQEIRIVKRILEYLVEKKA